MNKIFCLLVTLVLSNSCVEKNDEELKGCHPIRIYPVLETRFNLNAPIANDFKFYINGQLVPNTCPSSPPSTIGYPCISEMTNSGNTLSLKIALDTPPSPIEVSLTEGTPEVIRVQSSNLVPTEGDAGIYCDPSEYQLDLQE